MLPNQDEIFARQMDVIQRQNMLELSSKFEELFGFKPGKTTSRGLRKRLAYRLQEIYFGGLSEHDTQILNDIADKDPMSNLNPATAKKLTKREGTRFRRVWKGAEYEAIAVGDGTFEFNGKKYKSLSAVAREITGTRWNGKLFFGVKANG